jgi:phosphoribosylformimino-5-aminoimidazole carboxamide ribotide isomerase
MHSFRIIPVIDLLNTEAVHAVKGERDKYKPLKSKLIDTSNPIKIINIIKQKLGLFEIYIADLDSIINRKPNLDLLTKILEIPDVKIMLDPGIISKNDLQRFSELKINKLILGLETINNIDLIKEAITIMGKKKIIVSIDMYQEKILSNIMELKNQNPIQIVSQLEKIGIKELILLDLFRVGQKVGGLPTLYLNIRKEFQGSILIGGGVKDSNDLLNLYKNGFNGALIATSLYDGTIEAEELKNLL